MASMSDSDDDIPPYSDLSSVSSDSSDRVRGNLFIRVLNKADRVRGKTEDLLNDIHESYSFPDAVDLCDRGAGEVIFSGNCAACHAGGNNVIAAEKTLRKDALDKYLAGGRKESSVVTQVTNGKNAMPAFGGRLSDEEIGDVAAYVIDQANGDKWDD